MNKVLKDSDKIYKKNRIDSNIKFWFWVFEILIKFLYTLNSNMTNTI